MSAFLFIMTNIINTIAEISLLFSGRKSKFQPLEANKKDNHLSLENSLLVNMDRILVVCIPLIISLKTLQ